MKLKYVLAAVAALATASAAQAASSLSVSISAPVVTATGGFSWLSFGYGLGAVVEDQTGWANGTTPTLAPLVLDYDYGQTANVTTAAGNIASASVVPTGYDFFVATGNAGGIAVSNLDIYGTFSLAPGATFTLSWTRTISGSNSGQANPSSAYDFENSLVVNTSGYIADQWTGFTPIYNTGNVNSGAGFSIADGPVLQSLSYTNTSDTTLVAEFRGSVQVYSRDIVTAVPEPEQYAMLLAGLAVVGAFARVKRRR